MRGENTRILIIGGVAAGPKTAARARRLLPDAEITIIEKGQLISYGGCGMPFFCGRINTKPRGANDNSLWCCAYCKLL